MKRKDRWTPVQRPFSLNCSLNNKLLSNSSRVSNYAISSETVNNAINDLSDRVYNLLSRSLSLVTTRSERDSSNCYEHKY